ncbi:MAG TPA: ABC transporter permease [Erysipelothrix sp.]
MKRKLFTAPLFIYFATFLILPLVFLIIVSFSTKDDLGNILPIFSLAAYQKILSPTYLKILLSSFKLAFITAVLALFLGYPIAYFISQMKTKYKRVLLLLMMLPFWISSLLRTYGWMILLGKEGLINRFLMAVKLTNQPLDLMYRFESVLVVTLYMLIPFMILSVFNSLDQIDPSYLEASADLGASKRQTFFNVILNLSMPGIIRGFALVFIPALSMYFVSDLIGGGQVIFVGNLINTQLSKARNKPQAAALAIVLLILVIIFLYLTSKILKKWKGDAREENSSL